MKRFKLAVIGLTLLSSLAFANFNDVPRDHWAFESVRNLYNKGLLAKTVEESPTFKGDEAFTRYEVVSMVYLSLQNIDEKIDQKANLEDVAALKALLTNFAPELAKMGLEIKDTDKKLTELEKQISKKIGKKLDRLSEKVDKIKITGDLTASQEIRMKENNPGMDELEYEGNIVISAKPNDKVSAKIRMNVDQASKEDEFVSIDGIEVKGQTAGGTFSAFRDSDKQVASFENTMSQFDAATVDPEQGVIVNNNYEIAKNSGRYVGMFYQTESGDFYGFQAKQNIDSLKSKGINAFVRGSYSEKITKYQYDSDPESDKARNQDDAKSIYSIDAEATFKELPMVELTVATEMATRRSPMVKNLESDSVEYLPLIDSFLGSRDALYLYSRAKLKNKLGLTFYGGFYNSGEYFDISGLGDDTKTVFSETGIIKSEANKKALLGKVKYDFMEKNWITTELTYASYGANNVDANPAKDIAWLTTWNVLKGNKFKAELEIGWDVEERLPEDDYQDIMDATYTDNAGVVQQSDEIQGSVDGEKGIFRIHQRNTLSLLNMNDQQHINFIYEDDKDKDDKEDTDKLFSIHLDNEMDITDEIYFKAGILYQLNGLGLKDYQQWKTISGNWEERTEFKSHDERTTVEFGTAVTYTPKNDKVGEFNLGTYYKNEDKKGGVNIYSSGTSDDLGAYTQEDKKYKDDKQEISFFVAHEIEFGNWTFNSGMKYLSEKEGIEDQIEDGILRYKFEDKSKEDGGEYEFLYAIGLEYDFGNDTLASFTYGDPTIGEDGTNFLKDKTVFAEGEQDQFTFTFETKF